MKDHVTERMAAKNPALPSQEYITFKIYIYILKHKKIF